MPVVIVWPGGAELPYLASCVSEEDMIFQALSLNRIYNLTFYNKRLEQGVFLYRECEGWRWVVYICGRRTIIFFK